MDGIHASHYKLTSKYKLNAVLYYVHQLYNDMYFCFNSYLHMYTKNVFGKEVTGLHELN